MRKSLKRFDFGHIQTFELLCHEKTIALLLEKYSTYLTTFLAGNQVSDRCHLGYLSDSFVAVLCLLFWCQSFDDVSSCVYSYSFSSVWIAEWPLFGK